MENTKKYFVVPLEYKEEIDQFTTQQAGELFQNLMEYAATGNIRECSSFPVKLMFGILKRVIDQNFEKYEEVSKKRSEAGKKGMKSRYEDSKNDNSEERNLTNDNNVKQTITNDNNVKQNLTNVTNTKTNTNTNTKTNNNSSSAKLSEKDLEAEFEKIWSEYPRKEGRKNAFKAYIKARKNGTSQEEIKKGLDAYISKIRAEKTEPQYIKHGSSWFNQECWLDDYANPASQPKNDDYDESIWGKMI